MKTFCDIGWILCKFGTLNLRMVGLAILVSTAHGQTFFVTNTSDSGSGSLRQAISNANNSGGGTVLFSNVTGTITMTNGEMVVGTNITIDASVVPGGIIINGNHASRIFNVTGSNVVMNSLTLTNGYLLNFGPAIFLTGSLTLNRCTLTGNNTIYNGGAICNYGGGNLTINECTFTGNHAGEDGGAIDNITGNLIINQCTFSLNYAFGDGGGIYQGNFGDLTTLKGTILVGNTSSGNGQDLSIGGGSSVSASHCLIGDGAFSKVTNGVSGNLVGTSAAPINALLGPLGNYGGPTPTMPLARGSPAIDAGGATTFTTDQRGFPRVVGLGTDIGAYESGTTTNYNAWIWELLPAAAAVAQHAGTFDFDGDGQSNSNEWLAGTDPGDANSVFHITAIARQGSNLLVTWTTGANRTNALQASAGNGSGGYNTNNFVDIFTVTNTAGMTTNYLDVGQANAAPARYYRVRLVL